MLKNKRIKITYINKTATILGTLYEMNHFVIGSIADAMTIAVITIRTRSFKKNKAPIKSANKILFMIVPELIVIFTFLGCSIPLYNNNTILKYMK